MSSIITQFNEVADRHADTLALVSDDKTLSYGALRSHAAHMALAIDQSFREIAGRDAGSSDVIGICLDKGPDLYATILAILAVGASYVPIDPELGHDVQSSILDTCRCQLVITQPGLLTDIDDVDRLSPANMTETTSSENTIYFGKSRAEGTDRCYTIFTSGSTGRPKGVQIHHQNLLNLVAWAGEEFALGSAKRVLQYSTINFDASVLDIFPTLLSGATLCIPSKEQRLSGALLAEFCERHQVEQAFLPPALLALLNAERFPTLTTVLTGGESCSPSAIQAWLPRRRVYNLYGPTECTVLVSFKRMQSDTSQTNIGQAISGVRLHVLDEYMQPAQRGELHATGLCASPGYIGDATTTACKFVSHPQVDESVLYKTGDIVEIDAAGDLHFIGRVDRQVKVRGYRIELEEVEGALMNLGYTQAAVKVSPKGDMIAYMAPSTGQSATTLRDRLAVCLSSYKIPQFFVEMDRLPLKLSGKVAYDVLPDSQVPTTPSSVEPQSDQDNDYAPIFALWAQVLKQPLDKLHPHSNFRDLGGTSLSIIHLLSSIETQFGVRISFLSFLNNPTPSFLLSALRPKIT